MTPKFVACRTRIRKCDGFCCTSKIERFTKKPYPFLNEQIDWGSALWVHRLLDRMFHVAVCVQWGLKVRGVGWPVHYGTWHLPAKTFMWSVSDYPKWQIYLLYHNRLWNQVLKSARFLLCELISNKNFRTFQDLKQLHHYLIVRLHSLELCLNLHSDPTVFWRINLSATD